MLLAPVRATGLACQMSLGGGFGKELPIGAIAAAKPSLPGRNDNLAANRHWCIEC